MTTKDVYLFDTHDGGEVAPDLEIRDGLETSAYLSIFGGNAQDDGSEKNPFSWWGNVGETVLARKYISETSYLLDTVAPAPKNLKRIEDAARRDLNWMISEGVSEAISVAATMPALNTVRLSIHMDGIDPIEFRSSWETRTADQLSGVVPPPVVVLNNGAILAGGGVPDAVLILTRTDGSTIATPISASGTWEIVPYPLEDGEVATLTTMVRSGISSRGTPVTGIKALLYNGNVLYDGTHTYSG